MTLGNRLSPILKELEDIVWEHQAHYDDTPIGFDEEDLRATMKLFMTALLDVMWAKDGKEARGLEAGLGIKLFVKEFTDLDTTQMY